jgi:uncharacterized protein DUF2188
LPKRVGWAILRSVTKKPGVHTIPHGDGWANRTEGSDRVFGVASTQAQANQIGQDSARKRKVEWIGHRRNGTIGDRRSYEPDPYPPKG